MTQLEIRPQEKNGKQPQKIVVHALPLFLYIFLFFKCCLMVPQLRLKTQSKNAERVRAENQYFPHSTLIRRAMGEAYCPTLVELVLLLRTQPCDQHVNKQTDLT